MALLMCCITKCLIFGACIELHLLFGTFDVLYCKTPLIFGACVELRLSFVTSNVLHCKKTLIFGACVQTCLSFRTAVVLHCKKKLYLALVLNFVIYLALWMCAALPHLNALLLIFVLYNVLSAVRCVQWSSLLLLHA